MLSIPPIYYVSYFMVMLSSFVLILIINQVSKSKSLPKIYLGIRTVFLIYFFPHFVYILLRLIASSFAESNFHSFSFFAVTIFISILAIPSIHFDSEKRVDTQIVILLNLIFPLICLAVFLMEIFGSLTGAILFLLFLYFATKLIGRFL